MLVVTEEKDVSVHVTEISIAFSSVQETNKEVVSKSRNNKRKLKDQSKLEDLQVGVKCHNIYHTKKAKTEDENETNLLRKELEQKEEEKNDF